MTDRIINRTKYNIPELVDNAIATVDAKALNMENARLSLTALGHRNPDPDLIARYARESAILDALTRATSANFAGQVGKINFSTRESTIFGVEKYLNRRIAGQHARWTKSHRRIG